MNKYLTAAFGGLLFIAGFGLHCIFEDLWWKQNTNAAIIGLLTFLALDIACAIYIDNMDSKLQ